MVLTVPDLHDDVVALRPPTPSDVGAITAAVQDPEIPRFTHVPAPYTAVDAVAFVGKAASSWRDGTDASFLDVHKAELRDTERVITKANANGWTRQIEMNERKRDNLVKIVTSLERAHA